MTRLPVFLAGPGRPLAALAPALVLAAACSDNTFKPGPGGTVTDVTLAVAQYSLYTGTQVPGSLRFPAAAGGAQYLIVAQFASGTPDVKGPFTLANRLGGPVADVAPAAAASLAGAPGTVAGAFHDRLRALESRLAETSRSPAARLAAPPAR